LAVALCAGAQDTIYKLDSGKTAQPAEKLKQPSQAPEKVLGWGSNIQNARLARAAETALRNHNYSTAVQFAQRAAEAAPNDARLWFLLGYAARLSGKPQLSLDAYNRGLRESPSSLEGMSGLAQTLTALGRRSEAQDLLNRILAADPKRTGDLSLLGEILLQSGEYDPAIRALERAERLQPEARSELLLSLAYQKTKRFGDAKRYLETAKKRAPNNPEVLRSLAGFYRETGDYAGAISALQAIREANSQIKAELAYTYQLSGKPEAAAKLYVEAAEASPQDLNLQLSAAQAQLGTGAIKTAKRLLAQASTLDAQYYRLLAIRAEVARVEERNEDSVRDYEAALTNIEGSNCRGADLFTLRRRGFPVTANATELLADLSGFSALLARIPVALRRLGAAPSPLPSAPAPWHSTKP